MNILFIAVFLVLSWLFSLTGLRLWNFFLGLNTIQKKLNFRI
jgi:hypothetical protein